MQLASVGVRVIVLVVDVVCVMLVLIARVVVQAVNNSFRSQFSVVGGFLFTVHNRRQVRLSLAQYLCVLDSHQ